ncbi:unnamed protein product [Lymnaea stagnalis]|uniref:Uncharacterized protein n=1 Tax=Lymnaea stagnalis TaxID=6523 RepID=A0AAV2I004_LYMST
MIKQIALWVLVAVCVGFVIYLYFKPEALPFPIPSDIYEKYPDCNKGIQQCRDDFIAYEAQVDDEDIMCLLTTVFLRCIYEQCLIVDMAGRAELIGYVRKNLLTANFECDFQFENYRAVCLHEKNKCRNALNKRLKNVAEETICGLYRVYFKCVFGGCPMTTKEQKDFIYEKRHYLKEREVNCFKEFQVKDNLYKYNCTSTRNLFRCHNGECIHKDFICNGQDNCGDASDEQYCEFMPARNSTSFSLKKQRARDKKEEL